MLYFVPFMLWCLALAFALQSRCYNYESINQGIKYDSQAKLIYVVLVLSMIFFAGLRTAYNDTHNYMREFALVSNNYLNFDLILKPYGGYYLYRDFLFNHVSTNPQVFLLVTSIITTLLYMAFIRKYSIFFVDTIFLYTFGALVVSMAALKQSIAISISLWAIDGLFEKKNIRFFALILIAALFHPTAVCLISLLFLQKNVLDKKAIFAVIVAIVFVSNIEWFMDFLLVFGQDISNSDYYTGYSINPFRVAVESIPIILAFLYKRQIKYQEDNFLNLGINMQLVSFGFIVCGLFYDPVSMGRMQTYFNCLNALVIPRMLEAICRESNSRRILKTGYYLVFFAYFILDMSKLGSISLAGDIFEHVGIGSLFK